MEKYPMNLAHRLPVKLAGYSDTTYYLSPLKKKAILEYAAQHTEHTYDGKFAHRRVALDVLNKSGGIITALSYWQGIIEAGLADKRNRAGRVIGTNDSAVHSFHRMLWDRWLLPTQPTDPLVQELVSTGLFLKKQLKKLFPG